MSVDPDLADVEAVLGGDVERFAGIVERWQGPLVGLAYRFVRDQGTAEDMAQEAFVLAFRGLARWRREARFGTWLYSVALNRYRSHLRARGRAGEPLPRAPTGALGEALGGPAEQPSSLLAAEAREAVRRELGSLPAIYREALALFYLQERDLEGTAAALGVPAGTVKARLHRGRELLRARLARTLGGER
jgi:RNA polymerase sigma-70 factor (ECF subfamily)